MNRLDQEERLKISTLQKEKRENQSGTAWMYKGEQPDAEEYLLGRKIDKHVEKEEEKEEDEATALFNDRIKANIAMDMAAKMREDPLFAIRRQEEESRKKLLENPIRMKELANLIAQQEKSKDKKHKKNKKKKKKKKDSDKESESEDDVMQKYLSILTSKHKEADNTNTKKSDKQRKTNLQSGSHRKRSSSRDKRGLNKHPRRDGFPEDDRIRGRKNDDYLENSRLDNAMRGREASSRDKEQISDRQSNRKSSYSSDSSSNNRNDSKRDRNKDSRKRTNRNDSRIYSNSRERDGNRYSNSKLKVARRRSRSIDSPENYRERHKQSLKQSYSPLKRNKSSSPKISGKSRSSITGNNHKCKSKSPRVSRKRSEDKNVSEHRKREDRSESRSRDGDRHSWKFDKNFDHKTKAKRNSLRDSSSSSTSRSSIERKSNAEQKTQKQYGLILSKESEAKKRRRSSSSSSSPETTKKPLRPIVPRRKPQNREATPPKRKLTEEERKRKLEEMMDNAKWREEQRSGNLRRYKEEDERETKKNAEKQATGFLSSMMVDHASASSVEDRLKRNKYNIQRTRRDLDKNFTEK